MLPDDGGVPPEGPLSIGVGERDGVGGGPIGGLGIGPSIGETRGGGPGGGEIVLDVRDPWLLRDFGGETVFGRFAVEGEITLGELECPAIAPGGGGGGAPCGGGEIVGISLIDPMFSLLTTDLIEIPFESAKAAVSGSLFMGDSTGACVVSTLSFEGDVLGLIDSALNNGKGGKNCIPPRVLDSNSTKVFPVNDSGVIGKGLASMSSWF